MPALFLAFAVWQLWSVVAVNLPLLGFKFTPNELFWLAAAPALSGATLRIFYSFMVPIFGGRRWTALSTASLLIPAIGIGIAMQDPDDQLSRRCSCSRCCAASAAATSPRAWRTSASSSPRSARARRSGVNAGLGNLGVSAVQFLAPLVVAAGVFGPLGGGAADHRHRRRAAGADLGAERRLRLGAVHHASPRSRPGSA